MDIETTVSIFRNGVNIALTLIVIITVPGLLVGLLVAMFQAATQINEMSLSFLPKILLTLVVLAVAGPWLLSILVSFTENLFLNIPSLVA